MSDWWEGKKVQYQQQGGGHENTTVEKVPDSKEGKPPEMVVASSKESMWETCLSMEMATKSGIHP